MSGVMPWAEADRQRMGRYLRRALLFFTALAVLLLAAQVVVMLWARHELVPYEAVVAIHLSWLARGISIYHSLDAYPYTVSTYTPLFHVLAAGLYRLGVPALQAGRVISLAAFGGVLVFVWRLLRRHVSNYYARWAGFLLAGSTANLVLWATVCRVDMLGLCFSLAAFDQYSLYRADQSRSRLAAAALLAVAAVCTKQTMLVSGAAIGILLWRENWRRAALFAAVAGGVGLGVAATLDHYTSGGFLVHTVRSNINPYSAAKFTEQIRYLLCAAAGLLAITACGVRAAWRDRRQPFYLYLAFAAAMLLATAAKVGADLNYQIETQVLLALAAAWTLDRLELFPRLLAGHRGWVTLLQAPLALHLAVNLASDGRSLLVRIAAERMLEQQYAALQPYLETSPDPVLSFYQDWLLQAQRPLVVDPFMFGLLAHGRLIDSEPLRRDLEDGKFGLVIYAEDVFENGSKPQSYEDSDLPPEHVKALRRGYQLVARLPGAPVDAYLYRPRGSGEAPAAFRYTRSSSASKRCWSVTCFDASAERTH